MSQKSNSLELYMAEQLRAFDSKARPTRASGASTEIGDVLSEQFYVECKMRSTKNISIDRKTWLKLMSQRARKSKHVLLALQNVFGDRFVVMDATEFFVLLKGGLNR